jgi:hypothetical protein
MESRLPTASDFDNDDCRQMFAENRIAQLITLYSYKYLKMPEYTPAYFKNVMSW